MYAKRNLIYTIIIIIFVFLIGWQGSYYYYFAEQHSSRITGATTPDSKLTMDNPKSVDMAVFWAVWQEIDSKYVDGDQVLNDQNFIYGSIKGLVDSLDDPYTVFMTPEETKEFEENLQGSLQGIGAELNIEDGFLVVISPLKDSPAERAGLLPGDIIFLIEDETANEMTLFEAIMKIRGEKGTEITLTILREDVDEPFEVTIVRDEITIESVTYELLEGDIEYVSINQFSDNTGEEFDEAVQDILVNNPEGIILDLRYNGGGYLDIAVDITSEFVSGNKPVVLLKTRSEDDDEIFYVNDNARLPDIPLVVLVNEGSASASEILAGAIQDHKRGLIMGEQTYGKGSVQEIDVLEDGSSLRLTIAKWLTPSGRDIEEVGILPDRIIELSLEDLENDIDSQLEEARTYLLEL
ncbi:S41 family peptidase [Patescibacteria group bacterium]